MERAVADAILRSPKSMTTVPGDGFVGLTGRTACTYLQDASGKIIKILLETSAGESFDEVIEFFSQSVTVARNPQLSRQIEEAGVVACGESAVVAIFTGGRPDGDMIRESFAKRFKKVIWRYAD